MSRPIAELVQEQADWKLHRAYTAELDEVLRQATAPARSEADLPGLIPAINERLTMLHEKHCQAAGVRLRKVTADIDEGGKFRLTIEPLVSPIKG